MGVASRVGTPVWEDLGPPLPQGVTTELAAARSRRPPDVLVVGLGATGLTAAAGLAARGAAVVGVDAAGIGGGAAGANGGFLLGGLAAFHHEAVARYGRAAAARWYDRTLEELERTWEREPTARRTGSLRSAHDAREHDDLRRQHAALRADGVAVEQVDGPLGPALLLPDDGVVDPLARCRRLAAEATAAGAVLVEGARAHVVDGDVRVAGERWTPRVVLVAVDGGLPDAVPALVGEVTPVRLQMLATAGVDAPDAVLDRPTYHRWGLDYAQQLPSGALAVGGGRDLEEEHARGGAPAVTPVVQRHLERLLARLVDGTPPAVARRWSACSGYTRDLLPVDRWVHRHVRVIGGLSGHGNVVGPMLARAAVDELLAAAG